MKQRTLLQISVTACLCAALGLTAGCDDLFGGDSSSSTTGSFPVDVMGTATNVDGCGAFGLDEDDAITMMLDGAGIQVDIDNFATDCNISLAGLGTLFFNASSIGFQFDLSASGDCDDVGEDFDSEDLSRVNLMTLALQGETAINCGTFATDPDGLPAARCFLGVDETCSFELVNPDVDVLFDTDAVVDDIVDDLIDDLIPFSPPPGVTVTFKD